MKISVETRLRRTGTANRAGIVLSAACALCPAFTFAQNEPEAPFEEVLVTGSRIARPSNLDTSAPIQVLTSSDMVDLGRLNLADALRNTTGNTAGSVVPSSGGSWQSQATVDLLGVGSSRTLVLLDGRRLPGSPTMGGSAININQIPTAMVESVEVLKGGASAIYGSDAVAGVVNIKLKEDFEGFEVSFNVTEPEDVGGEAYNFSIATGISSEKGNITFAYEHLQEKPVFERDRPYTAASFSDSDGDGAYDQLVGISNYGAAIINPDTKLWEASPLCEELTATVPGFIGVIETSPATENRYCGYSFADVASNQASTNRDSFFTNLRYDIADGHSLFVRALFSHNHSFGRFAPAAAAWPGEDGVPANSPHNPYDVAVPGQFRWYQLGNRDSTVDDYSQDYIAGITGTFGGNYDYEIYYHHNTTDNRNVGEYYLSGSGVAYNLQNNIDFGTQAGADNMRATTLVEDFNRFDQIFGGVGFDLGRLPAGNIGHYIGAESFDIRYSSTVDAQSAAGLIGGSAGSSAARDRNVWAAFYEALLPITHQIDAEIALRYDDYSDFGSKFSPRIALTYRPVEDLLVRASWGKGFRAPSLEELSQASGESSDFATDYVACESIGVSAEDCEQDQYITLRQANPDLDAETSTFTNIGVVYETGRFTIAADIFDLQIEDAIRFVPIQDIVMAELVGATNPDPALLAVDRVTHGFEQPRFRTSSINGPGLEVRGVALNTTWLTETGIGAIDVAFDTTYFIDWKSDNYAGGPMQDHSGFELQPEYRAQLTTGWSLDDHRLTWNIDYIPSTSAFETPDINNLESGMLVTNGRNDAFLTHNLTYAYEAGSWGQYRLSVRNLTDEDPVLNVDGEYASDYDYLYAAGHVGRAFVVGATWQF